MFDNYHDIAEDSALHAAFKAGLAEVPSGSNVIVLSRADPPRAFADARINQTIAIVSWEDLRLTREETTAVAANLGIKDNKILRFLHEQSDGWIAGVTLMLERLRGGGSLEALHQAEALETVFDYFAGLIFDDASDEAREVLMKTAFLPRVSAPLAEAVTGKADAIRYPEELHRRHLFTDRSAGGEVSYQYHALFRAFLRSRASTALPVEVRRAVVTRAAFEIQTQGQPDEAFALFVDTGDEIGQLLSATTILEGIYFEFENLKRLDPWIERVVALLQRRVRPPTKEDDLRANSAVMMGATFRVPVHSMLESCLRRVLDLLKEPFEPNLKVAAASMLHRYSNVAMDALAERMASMIARPLLNSKDLSPRRALFYWEAEGYSHYVRGRYAQALECFDAADAIVREHSFQDVKAISVKFRRGLCERRAGLLDEAEATMRRADGLPIPPAGYHHGGFTLLRAVVAFDRGNIQHAIETVLEAYKAYDDAGYFNGIVTVGTVASNMAVAGGRFDVADQILGRLRGERYGTIADNYLAAIILNQAWLAHRRGDSGSRDLLLGDATGFHGGCESPFSLVCERHGGVAPDRGVQRNRNRYGAHSGAGVLRGAAPVGYRGLAVAGEGVHTWPFRSIDTGRKSGIFAKGAEKGACAAQGDHRVWSDRRT